MDLGRNTLIQPNAQYNYIREKYIQFFTLKKVSDTTVITIYNNKFEKLINSFRMQLQSREHFWQQILKRITTCLGFAQENK